VAQYEGSITAIADGAVIGWAWDATRPDLPVEVEVFVGTTLLGRTAADRFDAVLVQEGKGNGCHRFDLVPGRIGPLEFPATLFGRIVGAADPLDGTAVITSPEMLARALPSTLGPPPDHILFVPCDGELPARGLYPAETDGTDSWRWSGPDRSVLTRLSVERPGRYEVAVRLVGYRKPALAEAQMRIDGRAVPCRRIGDELVGQATIAEAGFRGWFELEIRTGPTERPTASDDRLLGLCIRGFFIRPA